MRDSFRAKGIVCVPSRCKSLDHDYRRRCKRRDAFPVVYADHPNRDECCRPEPWYQIIRTSHVGVMDIFEYGRTPPMALSPLPRPLSRLPFVRSSQDLLSDGMSPFAAFSNSELLQR